MLGVVVEQKDGLGQDVECDISILEAAKAIVNDEKRMAAVKDYVAKEKERLDSLLDEKYLKAIGAR